MEEVEIIIIKKNKRPVECYSCGKWEHYSWNCQSKNGDQENNFVEHKEVESNNLLLIKKSVQQKDVTWYLDNGASNHTTSDQNKFVELDTKVKGNVRFGDDTKVKIEGKCLMILAIKNCDNKIIQNIFTSQK